LCQNSDDCDREWISGFIPEEWSLWLETEQARPHPLKRNDDRSKAAPSAERQNNVYELIFIN
jgi:hypothetical protein